MRVRWMLPCLLALASAACASSGAVPHPFPMPEPTPGEAGPDTSTIPPVRPARSLDPDAIVRTALGFRGAPYRLGGNDPSGFDCSGLVHYVFAQHGITLPRLVEEQFRTGDRVKPTHIKPGDLLFFSTDGPGATHVGIAIGDQQFVHAPKSNGVVRVEALISSYWGPRYVGARRITTRD